MRYHGPVLVDPTNVDPGQAGALFLTRMIARLPDFLTRQSDARNVSELS
jgi:hypothetical protein